MTWISRLLARATGHHGSSLDAARDHTARTITRTVTHAIRVREQQLEVIEHSALVTVLCTLLARTEGLYEADTYILETAAELHEVGMFTVSPDLLKRPAPLSMDELATVRHQAKVSADLAAMMHHPRVARLIEHQYTDFSIARFELSDADLLLAGILRVADTIAAVTRPRPYQNSMPLEKRAQLLISGAGRRYHPVAVQCALQLALSGNGELTAASA
jgi:HD-GYP domain-containing protein (c-di-GMP phosphodiesterase class II)